MPGALLYARAMLAEAGGGAEAARAPLTPRERSLLESCATANCHDSSCRTFLTRLSFSTQWKKKKSAGQDAVITLGRSGRVKTASRLKHCGVIVDPT